ncbi:MAG: serine dehydratase beta chain [Saprospiraceae bacterium]
MGPWRAAQRFTREIDVEQVGAVLVELYGSLAKTGKGHGTDLAVLLGLNGDDPVTIPVEAVSENIQKIESTKTIMLAGKKHLEFDPDVDIVFQYDQTLDYHANGMTFRAFYLMEPVLAKPIILWEAVLW